MIHYHYWETLVGTVMLENLQDTSAKKTKKIKHVQKQEEFGSRKICMCVCVCYVKITYGSNKQNEKKNNNNNRNEILSFPKE